MAERQKRGAVDRINSTIDAARKAQAAYKLARTAGTAAEVVSTSELWIPIAVVVAVILIITFFIILGSGGQALELGQKINKTTGRGTPGSGNISSCTFYRGGDTTQGLGFGNPQMAALVSDISTQVGVPPAVVAGIMRVESPSAVAETDPSFLNNDYDSDCSHDSSGNVVACGIMQFTPGTFITTFNNSSSEMHALFGKNQVREVIDPRNNVFPNSFLRIYSIRDSIIATAFKIKNDKQSINGNGPWDQTTIYEIARRYYGCLLYGPGGCTNGPYNYGEDVWKGYTNCQSSPIATSGVLGWAGQITNALEIGTPSTYNRMMANISNGTYSATKRSGQTELGIGSNGIYWCTFLVVDSYNLAGFGGMNVANQGAVVNMIGFWKNTPPRYKYLDYNNASDKISILSQVKPGYAMLMQYTPGANDIGALDHAAIVKSIDVDSRGNGKLYTLNSNFPTKDPTRYDIVRGTISGWTSAPVVGFGTTQ